MNAQVEAALVSAGVVLIGIIVNMLLTQSQIRRERIRWLTDLKGRHTLAVLRRRLNSYPQAFRTIELLSNVYPEAERAANAARVATELNDWLYSTGGLCAEEGTRGALLSLREACLAWSQGTKPEHLYLLRNRALFLLRRDVDIKGLENYDVKKDRPLFEQLHKETAMW